MSGPRRILTSSTEDDNDRDAGELRPLARALIELAIQLLEDENEKSVNEGIEEAA